MKAYWASTSSNGLINMLIQSSSSEVKKKMELLIKGEVLQVIIDEQILFNQLDEDGDAIWSLMLASGYLKVEDVQYQDEYGEELDEPAIVLESKVHDADEEKTLKDTVAAALLQIEDMQYDTKLLERGIRSENIRHYGFAFEGKNVLIG